MQWLVLLLLFYHWLVVSSHNSVHRRWLDLLEARSRSRQAHWWRKFCDTCKPRPQTLHPHHWDNGQFQLLKWCTPCDSVGWYREICPSVCLIFQPLLSFVTIVTTATRLENDVFAAFVIFIILLKFAGCICVFWMICRHKCCDC